MTTWFSNTKIPDTNFFTVAENIYGKYLIPASLAGQVIITELAQGAVHEPETIKWILANRGDGIVIHAGAFIGDFLPALSGHSNKVYAFEPCFEYFYCATKTLEMTFPHGNHQTTLINCGLSSEEGTAELLVKKDEFVSEGGCSRIMICSDGVEKYRLEDIKLITLDSVVVEKDNVSVIHLDVEGFEENALTGATEILRTSKPKLMLEIASNEKMDSPFYTDFLFGELGYVQTGGEHGWNVMYEAK